MSNVSCSSLQQNTLPSIHIRVPIVPPWKFNNTMRFLNLETVNILQLPRQCGDYSNFPYIINNHLSAVYRFIFLGSTWFFSIPTNPLMSSLCEMSKEQMMLTAWFELNRSDMFTCFLTYQQILQHFVWKTSQKKWKCRECGMSISCLYFVSPTADECFYLWKLLTTITSVTSWSDVRSFNSIVYPTFHAAYLARGLLADDNKWHKCLQEASTSHLSHSLCRLFSIILRHCKPSQPDILWLQFRGSLCNNLHRRL